MTDNKAMSNQTMISGIAIENYYCCFEHLTLSYMLFHYIWEKPDISVQPDG